MPAPQPLDRIRGEPGPTGQRLPSIAKERWVSWVREADVLLVAGGDAAYLAHWMREVGWIQAVTRRG